MTTATNSHSLMTTPKQAGVGSLAGFQIICIAYIDMTGLEPTGEYVRYDGYNYRAEMKVTAEAKASVWLYNGTDADVHQATKYAKNNDGCRVLLYHTSEQDPLGRARADVMKLFKAGELKAIL